MTRSFDLILHGVDGSHGRQLADTVYQRLSIRVESDMRSRDRRRMKGDELVSKEASKRVYTRLPSMQSTFGNV